MYSDGFPVVIWPPPRLCAKAALPYWDRTWVVRRAIALAPTVEEARVPLLREASFSQPCIPHYFGQPFHGTAFDGYLVTWIVNYSLTPLGKRQSKAQRKWSCRKGEFGVTDSLFV